MNMKQYDKPAIKIRTLEDVMDVIVTTIPGGEGSGDNQNPVIFDSKEDELPKNKSLWED
jgi:hypothetical protein